MSTSERPEPERNAVDGEELGALWGEVYDRLAPQDGRDLGEVHVGSVAKSRDEWPFAYTNAGQECVNLTLEYRAGCLELNLTGWKEAQSDALKDWLQTVPGEDTVNALDGYEVIAFAREAYKKTPSSKPWWQSESVRELGTVQAVDFTAGWIAGLMIRLRGDKTEVKPAFHVRHTWDWPSGLRVDDALIDEVATEARRLLPALRAIWAGTAPRPGSAR